MEIDLNGQFELVVFRHSRRGGSLNWIIFYFYWNFGFFFCLVGFSINWMFRLNASINNYQCDSIRIFILWVTRHVRIYSVWMIRLIDFCWELVFSKWAWTYYCQFSMECSGKYEKYSKSPRKFPNTSATYHNNTHTRTHGAIEWNYPIRLNETRMDLWSIRHLNF